MLITNDQIDELTGTLLALSGLDSELIERCGLLIRSERYDEAVSRAFVVLEERLRDLLGVPGGSGVNLSEMAFAPKSGRLLDRLQRPRAEAEGIRDLFVGAFRAYRNRAAHTIAGYTLNEARGIIHLVNLLLLILAEVSEAPGDPILLNVMRHLDPAASERLLSFLESLEGIGFRRGEAKGSIPFQAVLEFQASGWDEPRPHLLTVFYLYMSGGEPVFAFRTGSGGLVCVPGFNTTKIEARLLDAGCVQVSAKSTPIRLNLENRNEQSVFDQLIAILNDLLEEYGAA